MTQRVTVQNGRTGRSCSFLSRRRYEARTRADENPPACAVQESVACIAPGGTLTFVIKCTLLEKGVNAKMRRPAVRSSETGTVSRYLAYSRGISLERRETGRESGGIFRLFLPVSFSPPSAFYRSLIADRVITLFRAIRRLTFTRPAFFLPASADCGAVLSSSIACSKCSRRLSAKEKRNTTMSCDTRVISCVRRPDESHARHFFAVGLLFAIWPSS